MVKGSYPWIIGVAVLLAIPLVVRDPYYLHVLIMVCMYIMIAAGVRLLISTGEVSFAQAGFWGIGAYASSLLALKLGLSFWLSLPLAGIIAALIAIPVGLICLRLRGPYFFMITLAFGEIMRLVEVSWVSLTGGAAGMRNIPPPVLSIPGLPTLEFFSKASYFYLLTPLLLITLFVMYRLERSRFGMTCNSIRLDSSLAETVGISIMRYKLIVFITACFFAGLAGSFYAHYFRYVCPDFFSIHQSLDFIIFVMVGGALSVTGTILGTSLMAITPEIFRVLRTYEPIIYGFTLVFVLLFLPGGLLSLLRRISVKIRS